MKKLVVIFCTVVLAAVLSSGCTHLESGTSVSLSTTERWAVLPLQNLAETPRASERVESILQSMLQNKGVKQLSLYPKGDAENLALLLDDGKRLEVAKTWARRQGVRYGITGSIQEWRYKTGLDGEPAVGITLNVIDLQDDDKPLWTATASRTGWGSENLTETTAQVLNALLGELELLP